MLKRKSLRDNRKAIVVYVEKNNEMVNHIVSEWSKPAQKENKIWHECVG